MSLALITGIMITHCLALIVPGPDVFLILRTSLAHGFKQSFYACLGVSLGIILWVFLTAFGLKTLFETAPFIKYILMIFSVCYLLFLSFSLFKSARSQKSTKIEVKADKNVSARHFFIVGFLTNISNPKAILYFASIFSRFVGNAATVGEIVLLVAIISLESAFIFILLGKLFSAKKAREAFLSRQNLLDGVCAAIFAFFALLIAYEFALEISK